MSKISRREIIKTAGFTLGATAVGFHALSNENSHGATDKTKLKIIAIHAHPDDPETNCGGTISLLTGKGHDAVVAYLTRGEAGIPGNTHAEAAEKRTLEAIESCNIMKARPVFLGQIDGNCEITKDHYSITFGLLENEKPDIVITHWPIDTHRDHRICSNLVYDAWLTMGKSFELYYSESMTGMQSQGFTPDLFVDITSVIEQKQKAAFCHESQGVKEWYPLSHELMEKFRGLENSCKYAEAFVTQHLNPKRANLNDFLK